MATKTKANLLPQDRAQAEAAALIQSHEELLTLPYVSKQALASNGTIFTVNDVKERTFDRTEDDEVGDVYAVVITLQEPINYTDPKSHKVFDQPEGARMLVTFTKSASRKDFFEKLRFIVAKYGSVANMTTRFVEQSEQSKAKGYSRAVTLAYAGV
jgi:hypothetical protein